MRLLVHVNAAFWMGLGVGFLMGATVVAAIVGAVG